jgi:LPXTG-motif cell wall-anchored protein
MLLARSIGLGMLIVLAGSIPRNIFYALNLRHGTSVPWAAIVTGAYLWVFWKYLGGWGEPRETREFRKNHLRAHSLSVHVWTWAWPPASWVWSRWSGTKLVWETGGDGALWIAAAGLLVSGALAVWATKKLALHAEAARSGDMVS